MDKKITNSLAVIISGYSRRWMESYYDKLFETDIGQKLKSLDDPYRYGIELGLNLLNAFFEQNFVDDSALKKLVKQIGTDAAPEISKRLINHVKESARSEKNTPEAASVFNVLLTLDDQTLIKLLEWLYSTEAMERHRIFKQVSRLSADELKKITELDADFRKKLIDLIAPETTKAPTVGAMMMDKMTDKLKSFNKMMEDKLNEKSR